MRKLFGLVGWLFFVGVAFGQTFVPVQQEPKHHLRLQNDYVQVFDVVVPAGQTTLFHRHGEDYFYVVFGDATLKAQALGQQEQDLDPKDGEAKFTAGPIIHRVRNIGTHPFHNLTVELLHVSTVSGDATPARLGLHQGVVLENNRIRIIRTILKPGENTGMYTLSLRSLMVAVDGGIVRFTAHGKAAQQRYTPGAFEWNDTPVTREVLNVGKTKFEMLDVEVK